MFLGARMASSPSCRREMGGSLQEWREVRRSHAEGGGRTGKPGGLLYVGPGERQTSPGVQKVHLPPLSARQISGVRRG